MGSLERLSALCFIVAMLLATEVPIFGQAGAIWGQVDLPREALPIARRPGIREFGMPPARSAEPRRRSVVYLDVAPREAIEREPNTRVTMDQREETFLPHVVAVTVGTDVDFPNSDETYHNVFSLSQVESFDLGRYEAGRSKSVRFDQPGIVRVFCDIHSHMSAFVLVFGHRFFAVTDEHGRYRIAGVPPGNYNVAVWHELFVSESQSISIPESGDGVELNFALRGR